MTTTPLETPLLGKTGLALTRVGFGARSIGGGSWEMRGPQADDDSVAAVHRPLELGVNWMDTDSDLVSLDGRAGR